MNNILTKKAPLIGQFTSSLSLPFKRSWFGSSEIIYHVGFWMFFYLFNSLLEGSFVDNYIYSFYASLVNLPLQIALAYFNLYYLLPKYILTKKYNKYFLSLLGILGIIVLIKRVLIFEIVYPATCPVSYETEALITFSNFFLMLSSEIYLVGLTAAIKLSVDWIKSDQKTKELEKQKLEAELGLLKAQIQPHFFFNTLNNLYSLTLTKSDQAPGVVQKLSELMSYLLYECENSMVCLQEEAKLIYNYIDLEKLRFGKRLNLKFDIEGNINDKKIPPYVLLPFVENAFKHGHDQLEQISIKITMQVKEDFLILTVINPMADGNAKSLNAKGGIGLKNVRKRLDLLFDQKYKLEITTMKKEFFVSLQIPLE